MSEAAWLRLQKCPRLPGSRSVTKMSEAAWLRHTLKVYISMATVWNFEIPTSRGVEPARQLLLCLIWL